MLVTYDLVSLTTRYVQQLYSINENVIL